MTSKQNYGLSYFDINTGSEIIWPAIRYQTIRVAFA